MMQTGGPGTRMSEGREDALPSLLLKKIPKLVNETGATSMAVGGKKGKREN